MVKKIVLAFVLIILVGCSVVDSAVTSNQYNAKKLMGEFKSSYGQPADNDNAYVNPYRGHSNPPIIYSPYPPSRYYGHPNYGNNYPKYNPNADNSSYGYGGYKQYNNYYYPKDNDSGYYPPHNNHGSDNDSEYYYPLYFD